MLKGFKEHVLSCIPLSENQARKLLKEKLDAGYSVNEVDAKGNTMLHRAVMKEAPSLVELLLSYKANPFIKNTLGLSPALLAKFLYNNPCYPLLYSEAPSFANETKVIYSQFLKFQDYPLLERFLLAFKEQGEMEIAEQKKQASFYTDQLQKGTVARCSVQWVSDTVAYGLFAEEHLHPGEWIGEYTGVVKAASESTSKNDYNFTYHSLAGKEYYIDAELIGNITRYINHSEQPNVRGLYALHEGVAHIAFFVWKAIPRGAQLFYNYGQSYWERMGSSPEELTNPN